MIKVISHLENRIINVEVKNYFVQLLRFFSQF